jgi:hypothetical protein
MELNLMKNICFEHLVNIKRELEIAIKQIEEVAM